MDKTQRIKNLEEALEKLRHTHMVCEDGWYSCPQADNYTGPGEPGEDEDYCGCGADRANQIISELLHEDRSA